MKKLMLITSGLLFAAVVYAQTTTTASAVARYMSIGPVLGGGGNWVGNMGGTTYLMPSANMGVSLIYARDEHWGWGGQLTIASGGYKKSYGGNRASVTSDYLRLPLRAYYFFNSYKDRVRPKLFLGPEVGVKLAEHDNFGVAGADIAKARNTGPLRTMDAGLNAGGGVNILVQKATWFNLDLGYYQGLTDAVKDAAGRYNVNHNLGIQAGLLFGIK